MTLYIGVTTFTRKDSDPPPYAGKTFCPVFKLTAPVRTPYNSYAI